VRCIPDVHSAGADKESRPLPRTPQAVEGVPPLWGSERSERRSCEPSSADLLRRRELDERWPDLEPRPQVDVREEFAPALRRLERVNRLDREQKGSPWSA
jgi:hypothetical protein